MDRDYSTVIRHTITLEAICLVKSVPIVAVTSVASYCVVAELTTLVGFQKALIHICAEKNGNHSITHAPDQNTRNVSAW